MKGISDKPPVLQVNLLQHQPDFPFFCLRGQDCDAILQRFTQVKRFLHRHRPAALQLADLKDVVHKRQQMLC